MKNQIEKRIELKATPARVWRALTNHEEFGAWFRVKLMSPFVVGQVTRGKITHPGYEHLQWEALVRQMDSERYFAFSWHPYATDPDKDYSLEPSTLVEFTLAPSAAGTLLLVTESGFDQLPEERRQEAFRMNEGGWEAQLKNIERHVAE